jgi:hypothetical protein
MSRTQEVHDMQDHVQKTGWQIVCQLQAAHPEWTVDDHVAYLRDEEGRTVDPVWVARWLRNIAADQPT